MFLENDDFFVLMDVPKIDGCFFTSDELRMLRSTGIKVVMKFVNEWNTWEPEAEHYDWAAIDRYVEQATRLGFKVIIPFATAAMTWAPDSWYLWTKNGLQRGVLSPWSDGARDYTLVGMRKMWQRYGCSDVIVVNTQLTFGETLLLNEPAFYDPLALASFKRFAGRDAVPCANSEDTENWMRFTLLDMMQEQAVALSNQPGRMLFSALHPAIADFGGLYGNGCKLYPDLMLMYRDTFPEHQIMWTLYTYVQWVGYHARVLELADRLKLRVYGGAEYAEGLPQSTPMSIRNRLAGQFIGPCHPFTGHATVEAWMLDKINAARAQWEAVR